MNPVAARASDEPPGRIDFQYLATVGDASVGNHDPPGRTPLPLAILPCVVPELAGEFGLDQSLPQLFRRGADVGHVNKLRFCHIVSPT